MAFGIFTLTASRGVSDRFLFCFTAIVFVLIGLWDASGLDISLARLAGNAQGFAWRENLALVLGLHEIPRFLSLIGMVALLVAVRWPFGVLRHLDSRARLRLAFIATGRILRIWGCGGILGLV